LENSIFFFRTRLIQIHYLVFKDQMTAIAGWRMVYSKHRFATAKSAFLIYLLVGFCQPFFREFLTAAIIFQRHASRVLP